MRRAAPRSRRGRCGPAGDPYLPVHRHRRLDRSDRDDRRRGVERRLELARRHAPHRDRLPRWNGGADDRRRVLRLVRRRGRRAGLRGRDPASLRGASTPPRVRAPGPDRRARGRGDGDRR